MKDNLAVRWQNFIRLLPASSKVKDMYGLIADSYSQYFRYYHTLGHLDDCFRQLEAVRKNLNNPMLIEYALWFHDIVCVPESQGNEFLSASAAAYAADIIGLPSEFGRDAADLIMLTNHQKPANRSDAAYLLDVDLAVLGREWDCFLEYERQIQAEYGHVSQVQYSQGRKKIISQLLNRPTIYQTNYFREKYENKAQQNLNRLNDLL